LPGIGIISKKNIVSWTFLFLPLHLGGKAARAWSWPLTSL